MIKDKNEWQRYIRNSEICFEDFVDVLLPWCLDMHESQLICNKYRGQMTTFTSSEQQEETFSFLQGISQTVKCFKTDRQVWTGFSDEREEGYFVDANDGSPMLEFMELNPFHISQPNGGREENCLNAWKNDDDEISWWDTYCNRKGIPFFCRIDSNPRVQIRGEITESE